MKPNYSEGQILLGTKRKFDEAYHPIVYLRQSEKSNAHFVGLMLTHDQEKDNIKMMREHFSGGFKYDDTYVVRALLLKPQEWSPFRQIGVLSDLGLKFIKENFKDLHESELWEDYLDRRT